MRSWCVTGPHDAERRERKRLGRPVCIRGRGRCEYYSTIFTFAPSSTAEGDLGVRSDWFATATRTEVSGPRRSVRARSDLARKDLERPVLGTSDPPSQKGPFLDHLTKFPVPRICKKRSTLPGGGASGGEVPENVTPASAFSLAHLGAPRATPVVTQSTSQLVVQSPLDSSHL